jgi:hypothetical protein
MDRGLPARREPTRPPAASTPGGLQARHANPPPATMSPRGPVGYQVALKPPVGLNYVASAPGFATMEGARLSADFYQFLASIVPNPAPGMWYASTQTFGNRLEATALTVGTDCLLAATGDQPMRRDGVTQEGRPQLRRAGPWNIDYVMIPFRAGTCHVSQLPPGPNTLAGGIRDGIDTHPEIAAELSNLPAVVQDHLESYVPSKLRIRRWVRRLGPTASSPEQFWLYTSSAEQLAYVHGARWHRRDPSGLTQDPAGAPWTVTVLTAIIGAPIRRQATLGQATPTPPERGAPAVSPQNDRPALRRGRPRR